MSGALLMIALRWMGDQWIKVWGIIWTGRWVAWMKILFSKTAGPLFLWFIFTVISFQLSSWFFSSMLRSYLTDTMRDFEGPTASTGMGTYPAMVQTLRLMLGLVDHAIDVNVWISAILLMLTCWNVAVGFRAFQERVMMMGFGGGGITRRM